MSAGRLLLPIGLSAGLVLLGACGKSEDAPPRHNRTLGDSSAGTPLGPPSVDVGILRDPATYQPASFGEVGGPAGAAAADTAEQEAVRQRMSNFLTALTEGDFDALLEAFEHEQIALLDDHVSAMYETVDKVKVLLRTLEEKGEDTSGGAVLELAFEHLKKAAEAFASSLTIDILDEENAAVSVDEEKLQEAMNTVLEEFMAELSQLDPNAGAAFQQSFEAGRAAALQAVAEGAAAEGGGPVEPARSELPETWPLKKIDGEWRIELPRAVTADEAEVLGEALALAQQYLDKFNEKLDTVETVDMMILMQIGMLTAAELVEQTNALKARFEEVFGVTAPSGLDFPLPAAGEVPEAPGEKETEEEPGGIIRP
jgi:hypothetical protein